MDWIVQHIIYTNASHVKTFPVHFNLVYGFHFSLQETFFQGKNEKLNQSTHKPGICKQLWLLSYSVLWLFIINAFSVFYSLTSTIIFTFILHTDRKIIFKLHYSFTPRGSVLALQGVCQLLFDLKNIMLLTKNHSIKLTSPKDIKKLNVSLSLFM